MKNMILNLLLCLILLAGCRATPPDPMSLDPANVKKIQAHYKSAIQSGLRNWPYPKEFNQLFPGSTNTISYYSGLVPGASKWSSVIGLHGRYVFRMVLPVELNAAKTKVVSMTGPVVFYLLGFKDTKRNPNGSLSYRFDLNKNLSEDDWRRLVKAKGDFSVLGITLETNKPPVEGFDHAWPRT